MKVITGYGLISGFAVIGLTMWVSYWISDNFTKGRLHGSAIAILLGLVLSYVGRCVYRRGQGRGGYPAAVGHRPAGRGDAAGLLPSSPPAFA